MAKGFNSIIQSDDDDERESEMTEFTVNGLLLGKLCLSFHFYRYIVVNKTSKSSKNMYIIYCNTVSFNPLHTELKLNSSLSISNIYTYQRQADLFLKLFVPAAAAAAVDWRSESTDLSQ